MSMYGFKYLVFLRYNSSCSYVPVQVCNDYRCIHMYFYGTFYD